MEDFFELDHGCGYLLRGQSINFANRVVSLWNSLLEAVVCAVRLSSPKKSHYQRKIRMTMDT